MAWEQELSELKLKRDLGKRMGGPEGVQRQHSQGRLTVRERVDLLLDPGTFEELYTAHGESRYDDDGNLEAFRPGNVIAGYGRIDGRTGETTTAFAAGPATAPPQASARSSR
jgi:acetyl-CoA carboxylase carboxyltransferase component